MPKKLTLTAKFKYLRNTKNTVRYVEDAPEGAEIIGSLYLRKRVLAGTYGAPAVLNVLVTEQDIGELEDTDDSPPAQEPPKKKK